MAETCKVIIPGETRDIETETESYHECSWELRKGGEKVGSLTVVRDGGVEEVGFVFARQVERACFYIL